MSQSEKVRFGTFDTFFGGSGNDRMQSNQFTADDVFFGGDGADLAQSSGGNDTFNGESGNDFFSVTLSGGRADGSTHTYVGGETGETGVGDTIRGDFLPASETVSYLLTVDEEGVQSNSAGSTTVNFSEVGRIEQASANDVIVDGLASNADQFYDFRFATGDSTVVAGAGNDSVRGSLGQDTIDGGTGDDTISTRDADDLISLSDDFGNDTITGGEAGETNGDTLGASGLTTSGVNVDFSASEAGTVTDDTTGDVASFFEIENIITTDQDDVIDASAVTSSGVNAEAGGGDDTLIGGDGADTLSGGDDADTFSGLSSGDVITGGEGGTDDDTIKVGPDTPFNVLYDAADPTFDPATGESESGVIQLLDAPGGSVTGTITFSEIENIMCFTPGTLVATAQGQKLVETLTQDDLILTRDNGFQPIAWTGQRALKA